jgi:dynein heavy chain
VILGQPVTEYPTVEHLMRDFAPFHRLWTIVSNFDTARQRWLDGPFKLLDAVEVATTVEGWWKECLNLIKRFKDMEGPAAVAGTLKERLSAFRTVVPIIEALASPAVRSWHWADINRELHADVDPEDGLTLQRLLNLVRRCECLALQCESWLTRRCGGASVAATARHRSLGGHPGDQRCCQQPKRSGAGADGHAQGVAALELRAAAVQGAARRGTLSQIAQLIANALVFVRAMQDTGVSIIRGVEDINTLLDDHLVKIQLILSSPFVSHIERQCRVWEQKLLDATSLLESWMAFQRAWLYLEPIFGSDEIMRQMPKEGRKFAAVDALWRRTMQMVEDDPKVRHTVPTCRRTRFVPAVGGDCASKHCSSSRRVVALPGHGIGGESVAVHYL